MESLTQWKFLFYQPTMDFSYKYLILEKIIIGSIIYGISFSPKKEDICPRKRNLGFSMGVSGKYIFMSTFTVAKA